MTDLSPLGAGGQLLPVPNEAQGFYGLKNQNFPESLTVSYLDKIFSQNLCSCLDTSQDRLDGLV